jgi:hypothetical protein
MARINWGQPTVLVQLTPDWGTLSFLALPYFREREFPGANGRLRPELKVLDSQARYESSREASHHDLPSATVILLEVWT